MKLQVEWAPCDLCGGEDWELLFLGSDRRHKLPGEFGVTKCRCCGHLQTNPRPTNEFLSTFYPENYSAHSAECHRIRHTERDLRLMKLGRNFPLAGRVFSTVATWRFRRIVPKWLGNGRGLFLEIGCGTGWLCALAQEMGWQVVGLDISLNACSVARQTWGIPVLCSDSVSLPFKSNTFRLVVLRHVLEHLPSPRQALSEVYRVLRENGWVALEVPNAESLGRQVYGLLWDSWDLPRHLHHFTPETLKHLMEQVGFQRVKISSAHFKPFVLTTKWFPRKNLPARFMRLLLGLPAWLLLPFLVANQQGEVLRAWGLKEG
ncbi:Ubiquinone/menaquinone biosynthesis C-methylase UbiE [Candidatus Fervidibacteria bacterium JGI MDM2 SSWTFF-3-K9]